MKEPIPDLESKSHEWLEAGRLAELGLFSAMLVHELKQPLFAVKALTQLGQQEFSDEAVRRRFRELLAQLENMEQILQAYSGMVQEPGDWSEPLDLNAPVRAACAIVAHRARKTGTRIETRLSETLPMIRGNPVAIQQVVVNLLQNAIDATSQHADPCVILTTRAQDSHLEITVQDNGDGVSEANRQRIFEPFFTTKPPGKGTGLGLTISHELIKRGRGELTVDSGAEGTLARIAFPLSQGTARTPVSTPA